MEANYLHKDSTTLVQDELVKNELNQIELQYNALKQQKFNELLKENQELKQKYLNAAADYETTMAEKNKLKKQVKDKTEDYKRMKDNFDSKVDIITKIDTQQKEFIKWLEDEIEKATTNPYTKLSEYGMNRIHIYKEILQKYKEIIGVSDENTIK